MNCRISRSVVAGAAAFLGAVVLLLTNSLGANAQSLTFETDIQPVLATKCGKCHGEKAREANLDLRSMAAMRRGGDRRTYSRLIERARQQVPDLAVRTTMIVGFPGEGEDEFDEPDFEAVTAGLPDILMITGRNKRPLEDHFDRNWELEHTLEEILALEDSRSQAGLAMLAGVPFVHAIQDFIGLVNGQYRPLGHQLQLREPG